MWLWLGLMLFSMNPLRVAAQTGSLNYDKGIELAQKLALEGKYDVARLVCERILRDVPDYVDAYLIMGNTYSWESKYDSARMQYYRVFDYDNGNETAFNQLIAIELWEANGLGALELANAALQFHPRNTDLLLKKARAHIMLGELYDAKRTLFILLSDQPDHPEARELYRTIARGVPQKVQVSDQEVITVYPVDTLFKQAQNYAWNEDFTPARQIINSIIDNRPGYMPAYVLLAQTYAWQNDYATARRIVQAMDLRATVNRQGLLTAVDIEIWSENYDEAMRILETYGLRYLPDDEELLFKKADVYRASGDIYAAKEIIYTILSENPNHIQAIQMYNELQTETARVRKNYRYQFQADNLEEGMDVESWMEKARELAVNKQYREAQSLCVRVLEVFPDDYEALFLLGNIQAWMGNFADARKIYESLLARYFDSYELIAAVIDLSLWEENYAEAIQRADYGLEIYPNDKELSIKKATAFQRMGDRERANEIINSLMAVYPNDDDIQLFYTSSLDLIKLNAVSGEYTFNTYNLPTPRTWQMFGAKYYRSNDLGTLVGGLNYGVVTSDTVPLVDRSGVQFEIDAYPVFEKQKRYFHLRYGFSPSAVFARHRVGAYVYQELMTGWEVNAGFTFSHYRNQVDTTNVLIFQAGLNKYWQGFMAGFLVSFAPTPLRLSQGYTVMVRKYFDRPDNWFQLAASAGVYPENPALYQNDLTLTPQGTLNSYTVFGTLRYLLNKRWIGRGLVGYQLQEFRAAEMRNNWIINLALIYLLEDAY